MSERQTKKLRDVIEIVIDNRGRNPKSYEESGIPVIDNFLITSEGKARLSEVKRFINDETYDSFLRKYIQEGDVLMTLVGNGYGKVATTPKKKCAIIQNTIGLRCNDKNDNQYLYYLLRSNRGALMNLNRGAAQPSIKVGDVLDLEFQFPSLREQQRVAGVMKCIDDKIELNTHTNQTLEQIAQALFKSWFVDFDPVKAKIAVLEAGGTTEQAELAAMSMIAAKSTEQLAELKQSKPDAYEQLAQTAALFPSAMQESELGMIPEGWNVEPLEKHLDVLQTGSRPKGGVSGITGGVPSVGAENILGVGKYTYGKEKFVPREFFDKLKRGVVEDFDFLLYKDGGKPGEFKPRVSMFGCGFPYSEFAINEHVFRMRSESLGQAFLYFQIGHKRVLDELANRGGKAAIPGINQTDVKTIPVLVPGAADLLTEFNEFAQKIIESILKKSNESNHLVAVRDTLLPKLLSCEIELSNEVVK